MYKNEIKLLVNTSVHWVIKLLVNTSVHCENSFFKKESKSFVMEQSDNEYSP